MKKTGLEKRKPLGFSVPETSLPAYPAGKPARKPFNGWQESPSGKSRQFTSPQAGLLHRRRVGNKIHLINKLINQLFDYSNLSEAACHSEIRKAILFHGACPDPSGKSR
jgi:hypothetical protein